MADFDFEDAKGLLTGYINLFNNHAAGEGDGSPPWTIFLHGARRVHGVAQSLQERLEECRTEFDQIKWHREEIAARERTVEQQEAKVQGAEQTLQQAQQALRQAEEKDRETQEKLSQLAEMRRQHQDYELQLNTRQMELDGQKEQQERELQAFNEEKAVVAREGQDVARNQNTLEELRKEIEDRVRAQIRRDEQHADFQRVTSVLEQQLTPALQKLNDVSAQVQTIGGLIDGTGHLHDRLESAQNMATQTTSIIEQQLVTAMEQLTGVEGRLQSVQTPSVTEQQLKQQLAPALEQLQAIQKVIEDHLQSVQAPSVTEQQLAPALERLESVSAQIQIIHEVVEGTGRLDDRLASIKSVAAHLEQQLPSVLKQQLESALEKLQTVPAGLQAIERLLGDIGQLDDRLASIESTTRMTEEEHDRMIMALRAEIVTAVYSGEEVRELRQVLDDIRKVPEEVEFVKTILTTDIQSLNSEVDDLRERNTQLTLCLEAYCNTGGSQEGLANRRWLAMINQLRRQLVGVHVSSNQGCNFRTILYHISKAVQNQITDENLEIFRVAFLWNKWYCWEDVMQQGQDATVVEEGETCSLHPDGTCFQVKRME